MPPTRDEMEKAVDEHMPIALGKVRMKKSDYRYKKKEKISHKPIRKMEEKPSKKPVIKPENKTGPKDVSLPKEVVSGTKMISMRMPNRQIDILEKYGVARTSAVIIALDQLFTKNGWL